MAFTFNGIGTTYYGKKNLEQNEGACAKCGKHVLLESYETRYWFVIVFIPIIPLGKKQIVDYCPNCSNHRLMPLKEWKQLGQEMVSQTQLAMDKDRDNASLAIEAHQALVAFNKKPEAISLAQSMAIRFKENHDVQIYLGYWNTDEDRINEAQQCFTNALTIKDGPEAKQALAIFAINQGQLPKARQLLSFMESPGPVQNAAVLNLLASAYQDAGQHNAAISIFEIICKNFPEVGKNDKDLRKAIRHSEKELGEMNTILPTAPFQWRWLVIPILCLALAGGGILLNTYLKKKVSVTLINPFKQAVEVTIKDHMVFKMAPGKQYEIQLPEALHLLGTTIPGVGLEETSIDLRRNLGARFFDFDTIRIVNIGGGGALYVERVQYHENPDQAAVFPLEWYVGERFFTLKDIDHLFEELPETIQIQNGNSGYRSSLQIAEADPSIMVDYIIEAGADPGEILSYCETHLTVDPNNEELLDGYMRFAFQTQAGERATHFLKEGLLLRPVCVPWHLWHQSLSQPQGVLGVLQTEYDNYLLDDPENSNLQYLRGRIALNYKEFSPFNERAIELEPKNPYPWMMKIYIQGLQADFQEGIRTCKKAFDHQVENTTTWGYLFYYHYALGTTSSLRDSWYRRWNENPLDYDLTEQIVLMELSSGDRTVYQKVIDRFVQALKQSDGEDTYQLSLHLQLMAAYALDDFGEIKKLSGKIVDEQTREFILFWNHLREGELEDAEKKLIKLGDEIETNHSIMMALSWLMANEETKANEWLIITKNIIRECEFKDIEKYLNGEIHSGVEKFDHLISINSYLEKACYALALAWIYPEDQGGYLDIADSLNYYPGVANFPLKQIIKKFRERSI